MTLRTVIFALVCFGLCVSPAVLSAQQESPRSSTFQPSIRELKIGGGDLLDISVFDTPELSGKLRVTETGDVSFPLIGTLHMAGLTPKQAQDAVRQHLIDGDLVKDPQVTVTIAEYAAQGVTLIGEVMKPGIYPSLGGKTLFDLISLASGLTPVAGNTASITHRSSPDRPTTVQIRNSEGVLTIGNVELSPGDTVVIERAGIVYVLGDVGRPGGFVMEREKMSVLEALALAQGTNKSASLKKAMLLRKMPSGVQESRLDLKAILKNESPDILLQAGDIVYIPSSATKNVLLSGQGVLQSVVGASIYRF